MTPALLNPGDHRAGTSFSDPAVLRAAVEVEARWLDALHAAGLSPVDGSALAGAAEELLVPTTLAKLAEAAEAGGNLVIPLVARLRTHVADRHGAPDADRVHHGLTSQDVLDTALVLCARELVDDLAVEFRAQVAALVGLVEAHRDTVTIARTLTQQARPTTYGLRFAGWLEGVLDARDAVSALTFAAQLGGPVGTLDGLTRTTGSAAAAVGIARDAASRLGLGFRAPWHTSRGAVTRLGDALVTTTDAYGRIADDVLTLSRTEIGELREPAAAGRGGSSSMPHKRNPALSVLLRRTALQSPALAAQLHLAAADTGDERPAGAWHTEWPALAGLARSTLVAARQAGELLAGLEVDRAAVTRTLDLAIPTVLAGRDPRSGPGSDPSSDLGAAAEFVELSLARAAGEDRTA